MGNKYAHLPNQEPNDLLARSKIRHSCSVNCTSCRGKKLSAAHSDSVTALTVVRTGLVISGSRDTSMALHNVDSGECLQKWDGHSMEVTKLAYGNMGGTHTVFSGSRDTTIRSWQFKSNSYIQEYKGHEMAVTGLLAINDTTLISGSRDGTVRLWDVSKDKAVRVTHMNRNLVTHLAVHNSSGLVAQTSEDKELKLWDPRTLSISHRFPKRNHIQTHCEWVPDGTQLITSNNGFNGDGCEITIWDVRSMKSIRDMRGHEGTVTCISYINQHMMPKKLLLSCSLDRTCRIWNIEDGACLWTEELNYFGVDLLQCAAFGDTHVIVSGGKGLLTTLKLQSKAGKPYLETMNTQIRNS